MDQTRTESFKALLLAIDLAGLAPGMIPRGIDVAVIPNTLGAGGVIPLQTPYQGAPA